MTRNITSSLAAWAESLRLPCDVSLSGDIAIFSPDRTLRYVLTRKIGEADRMLVGIGLNPSTATAWKNDPTIRRGIGFAGIWGCGLYVMLNSDAFRATDPMDMVSASGRGVDVCGEHNDAAIALVLGLVQADDFVLAAWGGKVRTHRIERITEIAREASVGLVCLGKNKDGSPRHPLYVPAKTKLQEWGA